MSHLPPNFPPPPPTGTYLSGAPLYGQHLPPGWENRPVAESDFWDAFDFSFERYATPAVVKVVYMLTVIVCVLTYVGTVLVAFVMFLPGRSFSGFKAPGSAVPGMLALVLGWVPAFLVILGMRVGLELALANVRTAIDARALRVRYAAGATV